MKRVIALTSITNPDHLEAEVVRGDQFDLPDEIAEAWAARGLVRITKRKRGSGGRFVSDKGPSENRVVEPEENREEAGDE